MNNEQKVKQQAYSEKLRHYFESESKIIGSLPDYSVFPEKMVAIRERLMETSHCFVPSFDAPATSHHGGPVGKLVVLVKRVIRKCTNFLLRPYAERVYLFQTKSLETTGLIVDFLGSFGNENNCERISGMIESLVGTREAMLTQIKDINTKIAVLDLEIDRKMNRLQDVNNEIQLKSNHLDNLVERMGGYAKQIEDEAKLKTNHLDHLVERMGGYAKQIEDEAKLKTNHLDHLVERMGGYAKQIEDEAQLKMNHLNFVGEKTDTRYKQITEDIDLRLRVLGTAGANCGDSNNGASLSITPVISNGEIDIAVAKDFPSKFFWAVNSDAVDPISTYARRGIYVSGDANFPEIFSASGIFLDVGANIGAISLMLAAYGWRGYAFEASAKNAYALRRSVEINRYDIEVVESAVYDKSGKIYFVSDGPWGFVQNDVLADQQYEEIDCVSLDDWVAGGGAPEKLDFIKIDVEGSEPAVLRGMSNMLERYGYPPIYIEMNAYALCLQGETQYSMLSIAKSMGYRAYKLVNGTLWHYDEAEIPVENYITDFMLVKGNPSILKCDIIETEARPEEDTVRMIVDSLSNRSKWNDLSRYGREKNADEYGAYICYALKDYPRYYENPQIRALLTEIAAEADSNPFLKKAIGWFRSN